MTNPIQSINLTIRFILEMLALFIFGYFAWQKFENPNKYLLVIIFPMLAASIWGVFNVPNDPSRSGKAPVIVKGWIRLLIEVLFFGLAAYLLIAMRLNKQSCLFSAIVFIHYAVSHKRIAWMLKH